MIHIIATVLTLANWQCSKDGDGFVPVAVPHDWAIDSAFIPDAPGDTGKLPWVADGAVTVADVALKIGRAHV